MSALAISIVALFSIPFVALAVAAFGVWLQERARNHRLARELDECLDRILAGRDEGRRIA